MKNLGSGSLANVTSTYSLDAASTYTYTWNVTFAAALGDVPEMTIGPADADLSSYGADVTIATVQVWMNRLVTPVAMEDLQQRHTSVFDIDCVTVDTLGVCWSGTLEINGSIKGSQEAISLVGTCVQTAASSEFAAVVTASDCT